MMFMRRSRQKILHVMLLLCCGSVFGVMMYRMSASGERSSSPYRVDFEENSSHFTMSMVGVR
jgi:hypothetical protein